MHLPTLFETVFEAVKILTGRAMDWIAEKISAVWNAIVGFITPILETIKNTFAFIWNGIIEIISNIMNKIYNIIMTIWSAISRFISEVLNAVWTVVSEIWNNISNYIINILNAVYEVISTVWNAIAGFISEILNAIFEVVSNVWNTIKDVISDIMNATKTDVISIWENMKSAISSLISVIKNTVVNGFNVAVDFVKNLAGEAWQWGADIIDNIVNGIRNCIGKVANAVTNVANTIRKYLHFSVPDKGPLTDFESWMPDFMNGLAGGIRKNQKVVEKAMSGVAEAMQLTVNNDVNYNLSGISNGSNGVSSAETINNYYNDNSQNFTQNNNSPKSLSRYEIRRQTESMLRTVKKV